MSTTSALAKTYDPQVEEPRVRARWEAARPFHVTAGARGKPYSILIPPPNVTAALHLGHALNNALQDVVIRFHRAKGDNTLWMPGTDHAGIATQTVVEKRLLAEQGRRRTDFDRDEFVARVQAWKDEYEATIIGQLTEMGCSCDWDRVRFTMDPVCARAVREAFFRLFADGLIYRGKRLVNWDPATQTALADDEVEMEEVDGHFWYLRYPLIGEGVEIDGTRYDHVTVATTRPETMLGDTAVAMNPKDPRYPLLKGRMVRLPLVNREIPIIGDDYVVLPVKYGGDPNDVKAQFATGYLKVTPAHDPNDYEIGRRHDLPAINVMSPAGTISRDHGWPEDEFTSRQASDAEFLLGLDRYEAREAIVEWFRRERLLEEVKPYRHSVGHSYRSHVAIEPYLSDQWYVRVSDDRLAGVALRAMDQGQRHTANSQCVWKPAGAPTFDDRGEAWEGGLTFKPERYARTFQSWHENIRDWCVSRQLWWGHRIPVWSKPTDEAGDVNSLLDAIAQHMPGGGAVVRTEADAAGEFGDLRWCARVFGSLVHVCLRDPDGDEASVQAIESLGFVRDPDVLDTWFSSALWPLSTMGWPDPAAFPNEDLAGLLETFNPTNLLCTAREIITLWVSRMVMFNIYFRNCLPFSDVFIHAMIQDGEGRKMSKSLGNGVDPRDIIRYKGADAMRFTLAQMTTQTQDVRMPVEFDEELGANTSPKFELGRRLANKLWNATRFALTTLGRVEGTGQPEAMPSRLIDRWMLSRLTRVTHELENAVDQYQFNVYAQSLYDLFWRDFCDWYLEGIKPTVQSDPVQQSVLRAALTAMHRLFQPVMPFITEALHEAIEEIAVRPTAAVGVTLGSSLSSTARWPEPEAGLIDAEAEATFEDVRTLVNAIREVRSLQKVNDKREITLHVADEETMHLIEQASEAVQAIAGVGTITREAPAEGAEAVRFLFNGEEHALSDLRDTVDVAAELDRLTKRRDELRKQIKNFENRLSNESYVQRAPAHLVEETRQQLVDAGTELDGVLQSLKRLEG